MPKRSPSARRIKTHRTYSYADAAKALNVHKQTVSRWVKSEGLVAITDQRPHLISGADLKKFLTDRNQRRRSPCGDGQLFCLRCRQPRTPLPGYVEFIPMGPEHGHVVGRCPVCECIMRRAIRKESYPAFQPSASEHIDGISDAYDVPVEPV